MHGNMYKTHAKAWAESCSVKVTSSNIMPGWSIPLPPEHICLVKHKAHLLILIDKGEASQL